VLKDYPPPSARNVADMMDWALTINDLQTWSARVFMLPGMQPAAVQHLTLTYTHAMNPASQVYHPTWSADYYSNPNPPDPTPDGYFAWAPPSFLFGSVEV
jgi:hypothetical protein